MPDDPLERRLMEQYRRFDSLRPRRVKRPILKIAGLGLLAWLAYEVATTDFSCASRTSPRKSVEELKEENESREQGIQLLEDLEASIVSGDYNNAINFCKEAIQLKPDDVRLRITLGNIHGMKGDLEMAIVSYMRVIEKVDKKSTESGDAYEKLGDVYKEKARQTGSRDYLYDARHAYAMALWGRSQDPSIYFKKGLMESELGNRADAYRNRINAFDDYKTVIKLDPNHAEAHNKLGDISLSHVKHSLTARDRREDIYEAMIYYDKAIELQPDNQIYRENLRKAKQMLQ